MKIISVVPSLTELLFDLQLEDHIIGITRFCIHPSHRIKGLAKVGGTKSLKIDKILDLKPDLIIANKEENSKSDIETLQQHLNVWVTDIITIQDALNVISELGIKTNKEIEANKLIVDIKTQFQILTNQTPSQNKKVAYLIWENPIMLAGKNTFIQEMIQSMGWENILTDENSRYPILTEEELNDINPDYILLSSEPFPFKEKHLIKFEQRYPESKIILVDGEMFSWYGSRMKLAPTYFSKLLTEASSDS
jgi:ABC-type Fe3+-hydroxamate transport system substrate-binding protein